MSCSNRIILLDKPAGVTSFKILTPLKKALKTNKVGHTGTLDRFASGLLILTAGRLTKLAQVVTNLDKEYHAEFVFGRETDTLDPEGSTVKEMPIPGLNLIEKKINEFKGEITQIPPDYSAVHIDGERAYRIVRSGRKPDIPKRTVHINEIVIKDYAPPVLTIAIRCSSGTYVRSIARDLGRACASACYVSKLRRTAVGPFSISEAVPPEVFEPCTHLISAIDFLQRLPDVRLVTIQPESERLLKNGGRLHSEAFLPNIAKDGVYAVQNTCREFKSLITRENGKIRYLFNYG